MDQDNTIELLESIGLSKNEAIIYLNLIKTGKSTAAKISTYTGIHRTNVYDILKILEKKGLTTQMKVNNKTFFYSMNSKNILKYHQQKEEDLKKMILEIEKLTNKTQRNNEVLVFEGLNLIKNTFMNQLEKKEPVYSYGAGAEVIETFGGFLKEFHKKRIQKKIPFKGIYGVSAINWVKKLNKLSYSKAKFLPSPPSKTSTNICGDIVTIIFWETPFSAIVIENNAIAEVYKHYFETLWNSSKIAI